jgi:hypothetical protein
LADAGVLAAAASLAGEYRFDAIELLNGSGLRASDPVITGEAATTGAARLPARLEAASVTVRSGSVVSVSSGSVLRLAVSGTLTIESGARLDVSGQGYAGGSSSHPEGFAPPFVTASQTDAGGSHGGHGIVWDGPGPAGEVYDSVYLPVMSGGGGSLDDAGHSGTRGGGVLELEVGELVLDGEIRSRGEASPFNSGRPAGAGGSVLIRASVVRGGGSIDASGADTGTNFTFHHHPGAGGGGRVALYADAVVGFDPLTRTFARGGTRGSLPAAYAAPGTVLAWVPSSTAGHLVIDNGAGRAGAATELPALGSGGVVALEAAGADAWVSGDAAFLPRWLGAWMVLSDDLGVDLGSFRVLEIDDVGRALLAGAGAVSAAVSWHGEYRFDSIEERNGSTLTAGDPVVIGGM